MTLYLRPYGRGCWEPIIVTFTGRHAAPLLCARVGLPFSLGGLVYRIVKVAA